MSRVRAYYGAGPLHLLATAASFAIVATAVVSQQRRTRDTRAPRRGVEQTSDRTHERALPLRSFWDKPSCAPTSQSRARALAGQRTRGPF
jgi:hypothetical protein